MVLYHGQGGSQFYDPSDIGREDGQSIVEVEKVCDIYTTFNITTISLTRVMLRMETNDDNDDGYPDPEVVIWEKEMSLETALSVSGRTRVGVFGHKVSVYLDGVSVV